jgi:hypothetical protein
MNTPLRDELGKIIKPWTAEMTPDITDEILVLIDSKMPEKQREVVDESNLHTFGQMTTPQEGWNAYRAEVKSILNGASYEDNNRR